MVEDVTNHYKSLFQVWIQLIDHAIWAPKRINVPPQGSLVGGLTQIKLDLTANELVVVLELKSLY